MQSRNNKIYMRANQLGLLSEVRKYFYSQNQYFGPKKFR